MRSRAIIPNSTDNAPANPPPQQTSGSATTPITAELNASLLSAGRERTAGSSGTSFIAAGYSRSRADRKRRRSRKQSAAMNRGALK
jgi:hypothetical protein